MAPMTETTTLHSAGEDFSLRGAVHTQIVCYQVSRPSKVQNIHHLQEKALLYRGVAQSPVTARPSHITSHSHKCHN